MAQKHPKITKKARHDGVVTLVSSSFKVCSKIFDTIDFNGLEWKDLLLLYLGEDVQSDGQLFSGSQVNLLHVGRVFTRVSGSPTD